MKYRLTFDLDLTEENLQEYAEDMKQELGPEVAELPFEQLAERDIKRSFAVDEEVERLMTNFSIQKVDEIVDTAEMASDFIHYTRGWVGYASARLEITRAILDEAEVWIDEGTKEMLEEVYPDKDHYVWSRVSVRD